MVEIPVPDYIYKSVEVNGATYFPSGKTDQIQICEVIRDWLQEGAELYQQYGKEIDIRQLSYRTLRGYIQRVGWQLEEALKAAEPKWKILAVEDLPNVEYPQQSRADKIHQS